MIQTKSWVSILCWDGKADLHFWSEWRKIAATFVVCGGVTWGKKIFMSLVGRWVDRGRKGRRRGRGRESGRRIETRIRKPFRFEFVVSVVQHPMV